jgi:hypothetical protein
MLERIKLEFSVLWCLWVHGANWISYKGEWWIQCPKCGEW